ncbi:MAG: DUF2058 family protein, partial [Sinobacteraceae bacterium]|nr:DUF2058 family protein [Nevskiaceae bacterium]
MNSSLRDQLLSLGLVTEKQARQATQQEQQRQFRDRSKAPPPPTPQPPPQVRQQLTARSARDQELNRRRQDKAQRKARLAEIQ